MDFGILIPPVFAPDRLISIAGRSERLGVSSFWYPDEKFFRECYVGLTLVAANTRSMNVGVCVTDPYSRHPIMTAAAIGSVAEVAPGRTWLGLGAGGRGFGAMGIERKRPATAIREAVQIIRSLTVGESVAFQGKVMSLQERKLDFRPPPDIPIMIATGYGHAIQRLAGEIGDAAMLANYATPESIRPVFQRVEQGMANAGGTGSDLRLISRVDVAVHEDGELARMAVAPAILSAIRASYPSLAYLDDLPAFTLSSRLLDVIRRKDYQTRSRCADPELSGPLIPPALTRQMSIAGTPEEVRDRIVTILQIGIFDELTIRPVPSGVQSMDDCLERVHEVITPFVNGAKRVDEKEVNAVR